jgi:hypothetical protein
MHKIILIFVTFLTLLTIFTDSIQTYACSIAFSPPLAIQAKIENIRELQKVFAKNNIQAS